MHKDITSNLSEEDSRHTKGAVKAVLDASGTQRAIQALLEDLYHGCASADKSVSSPLDNVLELLHNHAILLKAQESLSSQSQDKSSLDVVFWVCISTMIGVLNLFLDLELPYTWREASMVVTKAQEHRSTHVHSIWTWVLDFVYEGRLPFHSYGYIRQTVLEDEDVLQEIQEELSEKLKAGFIKA